MLGAAWAGRMDRLDYSFSPLAQHDAEMLSSVRSDADPLRATSVQNNNDNTIETTRADRPDKSSLFQSKHEAGHWRAPQNN